MPFATYDLLVIGSGPAGQKAAIAAAKHGKRAAIVDRRNLLGGVSLHSGTIPEQDTARKRFSTSRAIDNARSTALTTC